MDGPPGMGGSPGMGGQDNTPIIPKTANVWDVLDHILNKKPLDKGEEKEPPKQSNPSVNSMPSLMS
jgi:hypothetical protein